MITFILFIFFSLIPIIYFLVIIIQLYIIHSSITLCLQSFVLKLVEGRIFKMQITLEENIFIYIYIFFFISSIIKPFSLYLFTAHSFFHLLLLNPSKLNGRDTIFLLVLHVNLLDITCTFILCWH